MSVHRRREMARLPPPPHIGLRLYFRRERRKMERVAPVAAPAVPSWRRAAVFFVATVAVVAVVSHAILNQSSGFRADALLQTGEKTSYERALEAKLASSLKAARTTNLRMGEDFYNEMHSWTSQVMGGQGGQADCGVPGGATDRRRGGCVIPVDGSTADLSCCTSCCQGLMGECGPCDGLRPNVQHAHPSAHPTLPESSGPESTDCGTPGTPSDRRRPGCIIPVDGSTAELTCCTSCCQGLMGECGDCAGLGTVVKHTVVNA